VATLLAVVVGETVPQGVVAQLIAQVTPFPLGSSLTAATNCTVPSGGIVLLPCRETATVMGSLKWLLLPPHPLVSNPNAKSERAAEKQTKCLTKSSLARRGGGMEGRRKQLYDFARPSEP